MCQQPTYDRSHKIYELHARLDVVLRRVLRRARRLRAEAWIEQAIHAPT